MGYADPLANEAGQIYRACGWLRLGAGNGRRAGEKATRYFARRNNLAAWLDERTLRRDHGLWIADVRALGWQVKLVPEKERFIFLAGHGRHPARKALRYQPLPWPLA